MSDQRHAVEPERLEQVVVVQREVVHVAQVVELGDVVEAGSDRRHHDMAPGELRDDGIVSAHAMRAVQPHDRGAFTGPMDLHLAAAVERDHLAAEHARSLLRCNAQRRRLANLGEGVLRPPLVLPLVETMAQLRHHLAGVVMPAKAGIQ